MKVHSDGAADPLADKSRCPHGQPGVVDLRFARPRPASPAKRSYFFGAARVPYRERADFVVMKRPSIGGGGAIGPKAQDALRWPLTALPRKGSPNQPRECLARPEPSLRGPAGPSRPPSLPCAAEAVRTSCSWSILKLMHASINAGGDACIDRVG
jgi:hypothetical protein